MTRLIVSCLCIIILSASSVINGEGADDDPVERGNSYIDQMLKDMFEEDDGYDPYIMEDSSIGFHKKVMFVNVSGEAKLYDGNIKGLKTLHRSGDCSLIEKGNRLQVKADLGAGVLEFHYSGSAKFMNFGPTITVQGDLKYIEVQMEFTVDAETGKNGKLTKFVIDDMRGMKVWVTGLGPINWAVNPIISGVTKVFKRFIRNILENRVKKYISERLPNYQFPVEGGDQTEAPFTEPTVGTTKPPEPEEETTQPPEPEEETTQPPEPEEETTPPPEPEEETTQPPKPEEETTEPPEPEEETTQPPEPEEETTQPPEPEEETTQPPEPEEETTQPPEEETPVPEEPDEVVEETPEPPETETPAPEEPDELEEADEDLDELKYTDELDSDEIYKFLMENQMKGETNEDADELENSDELEYPDK